MSKYDNLDARKELEQILSVDLKKALEKRGFQIKHNGTKESHAPAGKSDIEIWDENTHINVEVTKRNKSQQDGEWQSIKDHFENTFKNNANKKCYLWFISPETYYRTINSIKDWNFAHKHDKDKKMLSICFSTMELFLIKLTESPKEQFTKEQILSLFDDFVQFVDDENILRHFYDKFFYTDNRLKMELERKEEKRHQRVVEELVAGFKQLEQKLRDEMIATTTNAITNVIYLVFIKLYEEKKEKDEGQRNRFTIESFKEYQSNIRETKKAVHKLFNDIKNDKELKECGLFTEQDILSDRLQDDFVIEHFIRPFEQYTFYTTKVDGLGAAYEVLGQLSGKDVKVGQFFTPENVVKFMVKLADLDYEDIVFDPACGTGRFLTKSMDEMENKVKGKKDELKKIKNIRSKQLFGTDDDPTVAKLAKMNMYINGDGKTNIRDADGLNQPDMFNTIDVILTNPPLGNLSYWRSSYDDNFRNNIMEVIPKKNKTLDEIQKIKNEITKKEQILKGEKQDLKKAKSVKKRIDLLTEKKKKLEYNLKEGKSDYVVSGTQMKGGALFLNACKHYLKDIRDNSEKVEWRGGKTLIILDEGVLNTDNYKEVRNFINKYFFIKAVISLTKDTFIPVAKTPTKTSILYVIKKDDTDVKQKEPTFFAHVNKVGLNTKKKVCKNDLFNSGNDILSKYFEFKDAVLNSYVGAVFSKESFSGKFESGMLND